MRPQIYQAFFERVSMTEWSSSLQVPTSSPSLSLASIQQALAGVIAEERGAPTGAPAGGEGALTVDGGGSHSSAASAAASARHGLSEKSAEPAPGPADLGGGGERSALIGNPKVSSLRPAGVREQVRRVERLDAAEAEAVERVRRGSVLVRELEGEGAEGVARKMRKVAEEVRVGARVRACVCARVRAHTRATAAEEAEGASAQRGGGAHTPPLAAEALLLGGGAGACVRACACSRAPLTLAALCRWAGAGAGGEGWREQEAERVRGRRGGRGV